MGTLHEIDMETKKIVDECYAHVKNLLIEALAEELLEKESINLPAIINIIGERPFPMKESLREYLTELTERERAAEEEKVKKQMEEEAKEEAEADEVDAAEADLSKASEDTAEEAKTEDKTEDKPADDATKEAAEDKKEGEDK